MKSRDQTTALLLRSLVVALLLSALAACGEKPPPLPKLGSDDVILAFGDSLTYGTGAGTEEAYPKVLAKLIGRQVVGAGVPGETTADGLERLPAVLDEVKPRLVLLCMGGNDMLRKVDFASIESNLRAMVQLAKARGIGVVLIGVPTPELFGGPPEFYDRIAKELSLPLEKKVLNDVLFDRSLKSDPIHPNATGYRHVAEALAGLLRKAGAV
ncbi:MAG: arylesterase [Betaproteobacteria bacterium]|nr:arylesterase [Betaproteobacteria bacterium]